MIKKEDIAFLKQLIKSIEEASLKLEEDYDKQDYENFNKSKKFILSVKEEINKIVAGLSSKKNLKTQNNPLKKNE